MNCIGMQWTPMHWLPIQSIANAFHRNGMGTIGMDTYALVAVGAGAVLSVVAGRDRMLTAGSAG